MKGKTRRLLKSGEPGAVAEVRQRIEMGRDAQARRALVTLAPPTRSARWMLDLLDRQRRDVERVFGLGGTR